MQPKQTVNRGGLQTTLDVLPFGTEEEMRQNLKMSRRERKVLPLNVTRKGLYSDVIRIAGPALAEMLLSSLVRMVDQMMVGTIGLDAIAAVGLVLQPSFLMMSVIMALNTGTTAIIARARGAGESDKADGILRQSLVLCGLISLVVMVLGTVFARAMVTFMAAGEISQSIIDQGVIYLQIQTVSFIIPSLSMTITAALRGTGNSKPAMIYNIAANLINIVFNYLLINGIWIFPKWGVAGASVATVIGQAAGLIMAFNYISKGKYFLRLRINAKNIFVFEKSVISGICNVGIPAMVEQLVMRVGVVIFTRTIAGLGDVSYATFNITLSIQSLSLMNGQAFGTSATSLVGQSIGKRRLDMADQYSAACRRVAQLISVFLAALFAIFATQWLSLFLAKPLTPEAAAANAEVLKIGVTLMYMVAIIQPIQCSQFVVGGVLRGAGDTRITALIILFTTVGLRTTFAWLMVNVLGWGLIGAWGAMIIDQTIRTLLFFARYNQGKWKTIRL
ncbi:MAG: MATE family efflux transporter [Oscillospiraceae bacterium]|jgi:putative MATE family efflux protein|nr:MATE family efflux transporter [Oscillospiraceae bacterium]